MVFNYHFDSSKKIVIFGAGRAGEAFVDFLEQHDRESIDNILCVTDEVVNSSNFVGKVPFMHFDEFVASMNCQDVLIAVCTRRSELVNIIKSKLVRSGFLMDSICVVECIETIIATQINEFLGDTKYVLFDVGSRDINRLANIEYALKKDRISVHAFDPDVDECARMARDAKEHDRDYSYHPVAIWQNQTSGLRLHQYSNNGAGSIYPLDKEFLNRFIFNVDGTDSVVELTTTTIDLFCKEKQINKIDFLKINVDSAEYEVLSGAKNILKNTKCVRVEVNIANHFKGSKLFFDVAQILYDSGFIVCDVEKFYRLERRNSIFDFGGFVKSGILIQCDLVAIKDPIKDSFVGYTLDDVLVLAALVEVNGFADYAFEILIKYKNTCNNEAHIDIIKQILDKSIIGYSEFLHISHWKTDILNVIDK